MSLLKQEVKRDTINALYGHLCVTEDPNLICLDRSLKIKIKQL